MIGFKTDDRLPLFITDDRKRPTTRRCSHSVAPEAAVKRRSIVLSTSRLPVPVSHTCTHAPSTESPGEQLEKRQGVGFSSAALVKSGRPAGSVLNGRMVRGKE